MPRSATLDNYLLGTHPYKKLTTNYDMEAVEFTTIGPQRNRKHTLAASRVLPIIPDGSPPIIRWSAAPMLSPKARHRAGLVLSSLFGLLFTLSACGKLFGAAQPTEMLNQWGLGHYRLLIGAGELASAILFVVPRTASLGLLLLSAYMGGAIVTHMQHGDNFVIQSVLLALIWLTGYLRHAEVFQSFRAAG